MILTLRLELDKVAARISETRGMPYVSFQWDVVGQPEFGPMLDIIRTSAGASWRWEELFLALGVDGNVRMDAEGLANVLRRYIGRQVIGIVCEDRNYHGQLRVRSYRKIGE